MFSRFESKTPVDDILKFILEKYHFSQVQSILQKKTLFSIQKILRKRCEIYLETSRAPVDELDGSLGFDGSNGGVDVLGDNVSAVQHAAGHVFT